MATFGEWLRLQRRKAGLSQDELADRAACSKTYISNLERDMPHPTTGKITIPSKGMVEALAFGLDVPVREVVNALYEVGMVPGEEPSPIHESIRESIREVMREEFTREPTNDGAPWDRIGFHDDGERWRNLTEEEREDFRRLMERILAGRGDPRDQG